MKMSAGSQVIPVRIPSELLAKMLDKVERSRLGRAAPLTLSDYIRRAITRDLAHSERSLSRNRRRYGNAGGVFPGGGVIHPLVVSDAEMRRLEAASELRSKRIEVLEKRLRETGVAA